MIKKETIFPLLIEKKEGSPEFSRKLKKHATIANSAVLSNNRIEHSNTYVGRQVK